MSKYKLIIFDLDDTLFDYKETEKYAVVKACESLGIIYDVVDIYSQYKKANDIARNEFRVITPDNIHQFRDSRIKQFFSLIGNTQASPIDFIEKYLAHSKVGIVIDDVQETLANLKGIKKVVATNGSNYPRQNKLESSKIAKYFDAYFSSENLGIVKPNPDYFLTIMQQYNVTKEEVLIVGDDYSTDVTGAINLELDCCWFNFRKKKEDMILPDNVFVVKEFKAIISVVMRTI